MALNTGISWTNHTWNPFVGCEIVSAGCTNCYAMKQAARLEQSFGMPAYQGTTKQTKAGPVWTGVVNRSSDKTMNLPLRIHEPSLIFVNSMSDFWNPDAKDEWRAEALDIMWRAPQHQYQVLTKRPEHIKPIMRRMGVKKLPPTFWLGATVEDHRVVDRIDLLREVDAKIRFLSVEPMTAPIGTINLEGIHWVICGGESGPKARPIQEGWVLDLLYQCEAANVPMYWKQWGSWKNNPALKFKPVNMSGPDWINLVDPHEKGGSLLNGRHYHEFPAGFRHNRGDDR